MLGRLSHISEHEAAPGLAGACRRWQDCGVCEWARNLTHVHAGFSLWVSSAEGREPQTLPLAKQTGSGPLCCFTCGSSMPGRLALGSFKGIFGQCCSGHELRTCIENSVADIGFLLLFYIHIRIFRGC